MIHTHSLDRAVRLYPELTALAGSDRRSSFRDLYERVAGIAAHLQRRGCGRGDRLALLLPNGTDYIELVHACGWLGVIAVPINIRLSPTEIAHVLADAEPHGLISDRVLPAFSRHLQGSAPHRVSETELPKGGSGKILKRVLRERFWVQQERAVS
jgi:acyl-CoA synthetase (AMP-forming)/AMP-acid ligase II